MNTSLCYGQLGRRQEALENWRKLLADVPGASAETFKDWYHLWNMRDEDIAKLMDGVYKSGVLGDEARRASDPGRLGAAASYTSDKNSNSRLSSMSAFGTKRTCNPR